MPEDIARYKDRYLNGWDQVREERWQNLRRMGIVTCELSPLETAFTPRYFTPQVLQTLGPGEIQHPVPWAHLTDEQKQFQATKMAIQAAMIDRMDREIGHDCAVAPGSEKSYLCLGPGWASAGNTPFRRHKIWTHEGGVFTPLIVHWPKGITAKGELRHDVGHVVDVVPTLLDVAGITPALADGAPPFPGRSLAPALAENNSVIRDYVFFEHEGNRALRMGNYKLVSAVEDKNVWELYDLATDRGEQRNLAAAQPERVREMAARWQELKKQFTRDAG